MPRASWLVARHLSPVLLLLGSAGCDDRLHAAEREQVLRALDGLRDAPSRDLSLRRQKLSALERTPATLPALVSARDTCVTAYRLLLDGTELQEGIRAELAKADPSPSLVGRLLEAEAKIKQSGTVMPDCERAIAEVRLRP